MRKVVVLGVFAVFVVTGGYFFWWPRFAGTKGAELVEKERNAPYIEPNPDIYQAFLAEVVTPEGLVRYAEITDSARQKLSAYLEQVAAATPSLFPSDNARLAFYINAYNALVIASVLDHWPIDSVDDAGFARLFFREKKHRVAGRVVSLHGFETKVIREYDARQHFALNCAARSCPPLSREAYRAEILDSQLERATKEFLNDPQFNRYDSSGNVLYLSKILEWYADDFGGNDAMLRFVDRYRVVPVGAEVKYAPYDWSLNKAGGINRY